jgi:hypothetical protein
MYVFDMSSLKEIFRIPRRVFPSMWDKFDDLVKDGKIISVREVAKEIANGDGVLTEWAKGHKKVFLEPSTEEALFVADIFKVRNFQNSLNQRKQLKGGPFADPFLIAKAKALSFAVVTQESDKKPGSARIPNICKHFKVDCISLEGFMEKEGWKF